MAESERKEPKWPIHSLTPIHLELLISSDLSTLYKTLSGRIRNDTLQKVMSKDKTPFLYFRYYPLPLDYALVPYILAPSRNGPVLKVSGSGMKNAFYAILSEADASAIKLLSDDVFLAKLEEFKPNSIPEHRILIMKGFTDVYSNPETLIPETPKIKDDPRLPADFKKMAEALHRSDYYPLEDSLLVQKDYNFSSENIISKTPGNVSKKIPVSIDFQRTFLNGEYKKADHVILTVKRQLELSYQKVKYYNISDPKKKKPEERPDHAKFDVYFSTVCHILQSSGYGKSRTAWELGKHVPLIYTSLMDGVGYPGPTLILKMFISNCKALFRSIPSNDGCVIVYSFLCRLFFIILSSPIVKNGRKEKFSCDECILSYFAKGSITLEALFDSIFQGLDKLSGIEFEDKPTIYPQTFNWNVNGVAILETNSLENDIKKKVTELRNRFDSRECPLIFVVDEAQALLYEKESNQTVPNMWKFTNEEVKAFNVFRRVFRHFLLFWNDIWPLFLSTNGKISNFLTEVEKDNSRKPAQCTAIVPPIELIQTFDAHLAKSKAKKNWYNYLRNPNRISDLYKCGRPLIQDARTSLCGKRSGGVDFLNEQCRECREIDYLRGKIFSEFSSSEPITTFNYPDTTTKFTILGLSVAFDAFPRNVSLDEMIASHMMTLLRYDDKMEKLFGVFPPEGVLNGIASWYLVYQCNAYLQPLDYMMHSSSMDVGVLGETLAKINFVHASIIANSNNTSDPFDEPIRKQISAPVDFEAYLKCLTGDDDVARTYLEANPGLKGSLLGFSYFHKWEGHIEDPQELLKMCLIRGCGIHLKDHYPSIDLLLPLVLTDGRLSFVAVQVKLWRGDALSTSSSAQIQALHQACCYKTLFPKAPPIEDPPPYAILLINLYNKNGKDKLEFSISSFKNKEDEIKEHIAKKIKDKKEKGKKKASVQSVVDDILKIPDMLFINGAYSASMPETVRDTVAEMVATQLPIAKYMEGIKEPDILLRSDILSLYYEQSLFDFLAQKSKKMKKNKNDEKIKHDEKSKGKASSYRKQTEMIEENADDSYEESKEEASSYRRQKETEHIEENYEDNYEEFKGEASSSRSHVKRSAATLTPSSKRGRRK